MKKNVRTLVYLLLTLILAMSVFCLASCDGAEEGKAGKITVEFVKNGTVYKTFRGTPEEAAEIDFLSDPISSPIGYGFDGWYSADGVKYFDADGKKMPDLLIDRDMTLRAKFVPYNYTFILNPGEGSFADGAAEKTVSAVYDDIILAFPVPTMSDPSLVFDGWFTENGDRYTNGAIPVAEKLTAKDFGGLATGNNSGDTYTSRLRAVFKQRTLTVTLDYNDGSLETKTLTLGYGSPIPDLSEYAKDTGGEAVAAWSASPYNTVALPETVTDDIRIYAVWQAYKTVNFMMPSGEMQGVKIYEETNRITLPTLEAPGYTLRGWYLTNSLSGNKVESVHYANMQDTYYGNWEITEYTLSFSAKDVTVADVKYYYGETTSLPIPNVTGYTFRGWYVDDPAESFFTIPETLWGDLTLTANLTPNTYMVSLNAEGGRMNNNFYTAEFGSNYTVPVPEKEGYDFLGWYDAPTDGNAVTNRRGAGITPWSIASNEVTLYAYWQIKTFVVQFETAGGTSVDPMTYAYGSPLVLPTAPKKMDVLFHGWYTEDGATEYRNGMAVTGDITLYAKWIESTPIYDAEGLNAIRNAPSGNYHLMNDINLDGAQWSPIGEFTGILDGQGYKIYNFSLSSNCTSATLGFIIYNKGTIRNLNMEGVSFNFTHNASARAGLLTVDNSGTIRNCRITGGSVKYRMSAGNSTDQFIYVSIFAAENRGRIEDCYTNTPISGTNTTVIQMWSPHKEYTYSHIGGIAGYNKGTIFGCHTDLKISATGATAYDDGGSSYGYAYVIVGGIAGGQNSGLIEACTSTANLSASPGTLAEHTSGIVTFVGGLIGSQSGGVISRSYADATVYGGCYGWGYVGGFVGDQSGGEISNCYSTSAVNGNSNDNYFGAFAGHIAGKVHNCYADSRSYGGSIHQYGFVEWVGDTGVISGCFATLGSFSGAGGTQTNCHSAKPDAEGNNPFKTDYIYEDLFWSETVWELDEEGYPTLIGVKIPD